MHPKWSQSKRWNILKEMTIYNIYCRIILSTSLGGLSTCILGSPPSRNHPPKIQVDFGGQHLLMAEILHHLGYKKSINIGINYQPQLVIAGFQSSTVSFHKSKSIYIWPRAGCSLLAGKHHFGLIQRQVPDEQGR